MTVPDDFEPLSRRVAPASEHTIEPRLDPATDPKSQPSAEPTLTEGVLSTIWELSTEHGRWPSWRSVDAHLYRQSGLMTPWSVVKGIDRSLLWGVNDQEPQEDQPIGLTVAGLHQVRRATKDVRIFVRTLQSVAEHIRTMASGDDDFELTSQGLSAVVPLPIARRRDLIARQFSIWQTTNFCRLMHGPDPETGSWSVTINHRRVRPFTSVQDVAGYLAALKEQQEEGAASVASGRHSPETSGDESGDESGAESGADGFRTTRLETVEGERFTVFLAHEIARHRDTVVFVGRDASGQSVAVKRVSLRDGSTAPWYRDAAMIEREQRAAHAMQNAAAVHVMPLLGHRLDSDSFTFVYPLASTTLGHVVDLVGAARAASARAPGTGVVAAGGLSGSRVVEGSDGTPVERARAGQVEDSPSDGSPVVHLPARFARELYGSAGPDEEAVRQIGVEIAAGLVELHNQAVIHRDIKPANIMRWEGRWRLGDLGIAKLTDEANTMNTWLGHGTLGYMAPEVYRMEQATGRSDVFSLGCTLYALLTGQPPPSSAARLPGVVDADLDLAPVGSDQLRVALAAMLHHREGARPSAERVLQILSAPPSAALEKLRRVSVASARREAIRDAARAEQDERRAAADDAIESFSLLWRELETLATAGLPGVRFADGQGAWLMSDGDWRLVVQIFEPGSSLTPAVQLGIVTVEVQDQQHLRMPVANLAAMWSPGDDVPRWRVYRMKTNDISLAKVPVSESRHDGHGAVSHQHLEDHVRRHSMLTGPTPVMIVEDVELTADTLAELFSNEVMALEQGLA